ncbi:GerMN domain-containing protein [Natronincola ferrireducens]|uniref:Sporulation and spore germination n=1 Tax=Natronincola ferrireducens TaxID=393762 RepID=A0A1G8XJC3_9FIRM|nr:GerMN domain-containing protein [Natronincola ferrireducens]SDJ90487.1 Sporulation and spore germination [Natronincola ferrireducens]
MKMKKLGLILLIIAMMVTFIGCDRRQVENETPPVETENVDNDNDVVDPTPQEENVEVTLYYVNQEYVMTGDESLESIVPVIKEVTVGEKSLEAIILAELQKQPEDENLTTTLENIKVLSVDIAEEIAYVNLAGDKLSGGSLQEALLLNQILYSLTEIEGVEAVQILVDGSKRETLMGHITIEEPLTRNDN